MRGWEKFPSPPLLQKISEWRENQEKLVGYIPRKNFKKALLLLLQPVLTKKLQTNQ